MATAANVVDAMVRPDLSHGRRSRPCGDPASRGQRATMREHTSARRLSPIGATGIAV